MLLSLALPLPEALASLPLLPCLTSLNLSARRTRENTRYCKSNRGTEERMLVVSRCKERDGKAVSR